MAQQPTGTVFLNGEPIPAQLKRAEGCLEKVLENAFTEGRQTFNDMLCDREADKAWISDRASIKDVLQAVSDARNRYHTKRTSKAWKWLTQLSARVNYYGSILDVLVQHHPEYAALAWGAMKVLFVGVENHEESVHQLAKALCRFADCLPRQELKLILYPSLQMQQAVAKLYSKLIQFVVHAFHWYQKGKARRAIGAIFKPFALDFQEQLTDVNELSRSVDEIANTAAQVELRAVHAKVEDAYKELSDAHKELKLARLEIKRLGEVVSSEADRIFQVASCTQSLSSRMELDIRTQSTMMSTVQLNQIMSAPFMADVPSSGQSLKYCSTFARRQPQSGILSQSEIEILRNYSKDVHISYLITESLHISDAKNFLLSLLRQIRTADRPVIWALRFANFFERSPCMEDILRILVLHALEINSKALAQNDFPVTFSSIRAASSQEDWLSILNRSLAGLEEVYIVVDPDLLRFATENNTCTAADILLALKSSITSTRLKIIVSCFGINQGYFARHSAAGSWKAIRINSIQRQRLAKRKRQHLVRVRKMRNS
ncbi:MAG: hypothetical protein M1822_008519 [Bathelium mastoideum]|nr:MAG: hypothetical protein M1822_008519 [Bathelium mastoideum]